MPRAISYKIVAVDKFTGVANAVSRSAGKMRGNLKRLSSEAAKVSANWEKMGNSIKSAGAKMSIASAGIAALGLASVVAAGKNEALTASYQAMVGSAEKGNALVKDLYTFAAKTPFEIEDLGDAGKMLLAMGTEADEVVSTLSMLGEMAAATNKPIGEFALVYGQIMAQGKLTGGDAMQLTNKGIAIKKMIADALEIDVAQATEMISQGQISAELVKKLMSDMTQEGGRFFQMMEKTSATLPGIWSNTQDLISQSMTAVGEILIKDFDIKGMLITINEKLEWFLNNIKRIAEENPKLVKFGLIIGAFLVVLGPLVAIMGTAVAAFGALAAFAATAGVGIGTLVAIIGIVPIAIAAIVAGLAALYVYWDDVVGFMTSSWQTLVDKFNNAESISVFGLIRSGLELTGVIDTNNTSNSTVDVNLNAPKGVVGDVKSSTTGGTNLNVGTNLAGAM